MFDDFAAGSGGGGGSHACELGHQESTFVYPDSAEDNDNDTADMDRLEGYVGVIPQGSPVAVFGDGDDGDGDEGDGGGGGDSQQYHNQPNANTVLPSTSQIVFDYSDDEEGNYHNVTTATTATNPLHNESAIERVK